MSKDYIERELEAKCVFLGPLRGVCVKFVKKFIDKIYAFLSKHIPLDKLCYKLKLCTVLQLSKLVARNTLMFNQIGNATTYNSIQPTFKKKLKINF